MMPSKPVDSCSTLLLVVSFYSLVYVYIIIDVLRGRVGGE